MARVEDSGWSSMLLEDIAGLWKESYFCDVVIVAKDGQKFSAHSIILSAASPVLKEMIASGNKEITFDQSSGETCGTLLNFIYTGELVLDEDNRKVLIWELWTSGNTLQIPALCKTLDSCDGIHQAHQSPIPNALFASVSKHIPPIVKDEPLCEYSDVVGTSHAVKHDWLSSKQSSSECTVNDTNGSKVNKHAADIGFQNNDAALVKLECSDTIWPDSEVANSDSENTIEYFSDNHEDSPTKTKTSTRKESANRSRRKCSKLVGKNKSIRRTVNNVRQKIRLHRQEKGPKPENKHLGDLKSKCAYCGMVSYHRTVRTHVYEQHFQEFMPKEDQADIISSSTGQVKKLLKVRCLSCLAEIERKNYAIHLLTDHPTPDARKTNRGRHYKVKVGCLFCKESVKNLKYMEHFEEVHPEIVNEYCDTLPAVASNKFVNRVKVSELSKFGHLMQFSCVYCETEPVTVPFEQYKSHVLEFHPKFYEKDIKRTSSSSFLERIESGTLERCKNKEELEKAKYLFIDRSRYLPEIPSPPTFYTCHICEDKLYTRKDYYQHAVDEHGFKKRNTFMCQYCYVFFSCNLTKLNHEDESHALEKYMCETCGKDFVRSSSLRIHKENVHLGYVKECVLKYKRLPKNLLCTHCGATFKSTSSLKYHVVVKHNPEKSFTCSQCTKSFKHPSALKKHELTHTSVKNRKFSCTFCTYKTNRRHAMEYHLRIHTGEKPYKCNLCECRFRISLTLRWHLENKHHIKLTGQGVFQKYYQPEFGQKSEASKIMETMSVDSEEELQKKNCSQTIAVEEAGEQIMEAFVLNEAVFPQL